jgi:hypothetical protein
MFRGHGASRVMKSLALLTVLAIVMSLLLACGEEEDLGTGNTGSGVTPPPATATPSPQPPPASPTTIPDQIDHPTGADQVILRIGYEGGFVPASYLLTRMPLFSLDGDGCFVTQGPMIEIYPQPALPNLLVTCLSEEGVQLILKAAQEAGLLDGDAEYHNNMIADASTTVFIVNADGKEIRVSAYALGGEEYTTDGLSAEEVEARKKLHAFVEKMSDLRSWLPDNVFVSEEQPYEIERMQVVFEPSSSPSAPIAPEELEQQEIEWPLAGVGEPYFTDPFTCTVIEGEDLDQVIEQMREANQLTLWTVGDESYYLYLRPLLAGEAGCEEPIV